MNRIEEYIKKLLSKQSPPAELDADALWADIAKGLPPEGQEIAAPSTGWSAGFMLSVLAIIFVAGIWWSVSRSSYGAQPTPAAGNQEQEQTLANTEKNSAPVTTAAGIPSKTTTPTAELKDSKTSASPTSARTTTATGIPSKATTPTAQIKDSKTTDSPIVSAPVLPDLTTPNQSDNIPITTSGNEGVPLASTPEFAAEANDADSQVNPQAAKILTPASPAKKAVFAIQPLPGRVISALAFTNVLPSVSTTLTNEKFSKAQRSHLSAGIHLGSNIMLRRFASTGDDTGGLLNRATGQIVGQTAAINVRYHLNDKFALNTGIEYNRTGNTFRYVAERDTLIPHPTPPNTGLLNAVIRRSVAHNNEEVLIHLPIVLEYQQTFGDLTLGIGLGAGLNWQATAKGKTIAADGRVVTYESPLQRAFFVSYQLQPRLTWQPDPKKPWALELRADARRFKLATSAITGTSQRGWLLGAGAGIRYSF